MTVQTASISFPDFCSQLLSHFVRLLPPYTNAFLRRFMLDHGISLSKAFSCPHPSVEKHPLETWVSWPSFTFQSHLEYFLPSSLLSQPLWSPFWLPEADVNSREILQLFNIYSASREASALKWALSLNIYWIYGETISELAFFWAFQRALYKASMSIRLYRKADNGVVFYHKAIDFPSHYYCHVPLTHLFSRTWCHVTHVALFC